MGVFDADIKLAQDMIAEFGEACTWLVPVPTPANELPSGTKDWDDKQNDPQQVPCIILFLPPGQQLLQASRRNQEGSEQPTGDMLGYMASTVGLDPRLKGRVKRSDNTYVVPTQVNILAPNGQVVLYDMRFVVGS